MPSSSRNIDINKIQAVLSDTKLEIYISEMITDKINYNALREYDGVSIYNMIAIQKEYVETFDGKRFEPTQKSDSDSGYGVPKDANKIINYYQTFSLTKNDSTDNIEIHLFTNKTEEIIIELEKAK